MKPSTLLLTFAGLVAITAAAPSEHKKLLKDCDIMDFVTGKRSPSNNAAIKIDGFNGDRTGDGPLIQRWTPRINMLLKTGSTTELQRSFQGTKPTSMEAIG